MKDREHIACHSYTATATNPCKSSSTRRWRQQQHASYGSGTQKKKCVMARAYDTAPRCGGPARGRVTGQDTVPTRKIARKLAILRLVKLILLGLYGSWLVKL
jgi:hypothetical protein